MSVVNLEIKLSARCLRACSALTLCALVLFATRALGHEPNELPQIERGWNLLHDLDHDGAIRSFRSLQIAAPNDPRGFLYEAVAVWLSELDRRQDLDVSRFIDARHFNARDGSVRDPAAESRFKRLLDHAVDLLTKRITAEPDDVDALYNLGTAHAVRAGFEVTVGHRAGEGLKWAKESLRTQQRVITLDPTYYDAYAHLGMYDYVTGNLPFYVKWVAYLAGYRGNKDDGIRMLEIAAERGHTARRNAKIMLSVIYTRERRYDDALVQLRSLAGSARHNHVIRLNLAYVLLRTGRYFEAADAYEDTLRSARPSARLPRERVQLMQARALLFGGAGARALAIAKSVLADVALDPHLRAEAHLIAARSCDVLEQRAAATRHYLEVMRTEDVDKGIKRQALDGILAPFVPPGLKLVAPVEQ